MILKKAVKTTSGNDSIGDALPGRRVKRSMLNVTIPTNYNITAF